MTKEESGRYSALVRGDYLAEFGKVGGDLDRDQRIQQAVARFLVLPREQRRREALAQGVRILHAEGAQPEYYMWLLIISLPDELAGKLIGSERYLDSDKLLNAAIRLWLQEQGITGLKS
jgi:hypothetical protein